MKKVTEREREAKQSVCRLSDGPAVDDLTGFFTHWANLVVAGGKTRVTPCVMP